MPKGRKSDKLSTVKNPKQAPVKITMTFFPNGNMNVQGFPDNNIDMALNMMNSGIRAIVNFYLAKAGNREERKIVVPKPVILSPKGDMVQ